MLKLFAIRDTKLSTYNKPFCERSEIEASRFLSIAVNDPQSQLYHFTEDFELTLLGTFDEITGVIKLEERPKFIIAAISLKKKEGKV